MVVLGGLSVPLLGSSLLEGRLSRGAGRLRSGTTRLDGCRQVNTPEAAPPLDR